MQLRGDWSAAVCGGVAMLWAAALPAATIVASRPHLPGVLYLASAAVYGFGAFLCHQLPARSFHLLGVQMPVCARCVGIYAGAAIAGAATLASTGSADLGAVSARLDALFTFPSARCILLVTAVPTAATLLYEWAGGSTPPGWLRALAAAPLGLTVELLVASAFRSL